MYKLRGRKSRWVWIALVALSPIAYILGAKIVSKYDSIAQAHFTYDRTEVSEIAARFAKEKGLDVTGWETLVHTRVHNLLLVYFRNKPGADADRLKALGPPLSTFVLFRSPDRNQHIEVRVGPEGRVVGYSRKLAADASPNDPGEARSLEIARATLSSWLLPDEQSRLIGPETKEQRAADSVTRSYSWRLPAASHPELDLRYEVSVRGDAGAWRNH